MGLPKHQDGTEQRESSDRRERQRITNNQVKYQSIVRPKSLYGLTMHVLRMRLLTAEASLLSAFASTGINPVGGAEGFFSQALPQPEQPPAWQGVAGRVSGERATWMWLSTIRSSCTMSLSISGLSQAPDAISKV